MNNIEYYETSTPLTYRDYTATKEGSMYGILRDTNLPVQTYISQRTKIPNLFSRDKTLTRTVFGGDDWKYYHLCRIYWA